MRCQLFLFAERLKCGGTVSYIGLDACQSCQNQHLTCAVLQLLLLVLQRP